MNRALRQLVPVLLAAMPAGIAVRAAPPAQAGQSAPASPPSPALNAAAESAPPAVSFTPEQEGDTLMSHQRYQAAIAAYKRQSPPNAAVLNKLGIAWQMMFNMDEAMRSYQASLKLDPKNPHVLNNLGTVYDSMRMYGPAERMYRRALKIEPQSALVLKNLGTNLLAQKKTKKGYEAYKAALALDPDIFTQSNSPRVENPASIGARGAMNYYMALSSVKAGQLDRAIDYLRMALNEGFTTPKKIMADTGFAPLMGNPAFDKLLSSQTLTKQP